MRKESYDYEVKARAREIFRKFIKNHLGYGNQNLKVVCFPGEEALEIHQVYDRLAIPRENIVGIERDRGIYRKLKSKKLGINLFHGTDSEFFEQTKDRFDIISLDYQGEFNNKAIDTLSLISAEQILNSRGILLTNFYGLREKGLEPINYIQAFDKKLSMDFYLWLEEDKHKTETDEKHNKRIFSRFLEAKGLDYEHFRDVGITRKILKIFQEGKNNRYIPEIFVANPSFKKINEDYKEKIRKYWEDNISNKMNIEEARNICSELACGFIYLVDERDYSRKRLEHIIDEQIYNRTKGVDIKALGYIADLLRNDCLVIFDYEEYFEGHFEKLSDDLKKSKFNDDRLIAYFLRDSRKPYFPTTIKRYKYLSDAKAPMYLDMISFDQHLEVFSKWNNFFEINNDESSLNFRMFCREAITQKDVDRIKEELAKDCNMLSQLYIDSELQNPTKRIFLGSSYKSRAKPEEVAKLLINGTSKEEIRDKFRISNHELGAVKAHIRMGHYEHLKPKPVPQPEEKITVIKPSKEEQEAIKKGNKIEIYKSVLVGLPDEEITSKHKLQKMELAGYKAVIKRGADQDIINEAKGIIWQMDKKEIIPMIVRECHKNGISFMQNGYIDNSNDINHLRYLGYQVNENPKNCGLYIVTNASNNFRYLEDICLENSEDFFIPSILVSENSCFKDKLRELVSTEKELGIISRMFFHQNSSPLFSKKEKLEEVLENSFLVR